MEMYFISRMVFGEGKHAFFGGYFRRLTRALTKVGMGLNSLEFLKGVGGMFMLPMVM